MKTKIIFILLLLCSFINAQNWQVVNITTTEDLNDIFFISESEGYVASEVGSIFKTTDGGENWQLIFNNPSIKFNYVCAILENSGITKLMAYGNQQNGQSTLVSTFPNEDFVNWNVQNIDYSPNANYLPNEINGLDCFNNELI